MAKSRIGKIYGDKCLTLCFNSQFMEAIIAKSLEHSLSYKNYRSQISEMLENQKLDGLPPDDMIHYTLLNETRMNRLEKTISVLDESTAVLEKLTQKYTWLVLSEGWCGDAAQILPILDKMAGVSGNVTLKIVFRDEHEPLMNLFLTNGAKSIPKLIVLDSDNRVLADWGPRPQGAADLINRYKAEVGPIDETAINDLQLWYLHDKGTSTQREICELMQKVDQ